MSPEQREKTALVLCSGIHALHHMPATTTEEWFEKSLDSLIELWEVFIADARQCYRQRRENHNNQNLER